MIFMGQGKQAMNHRKAFPAPTLSFSEVQVGGLRKVEILRITAIERCLTFLAAILMANKAINHMNYAKKWIFYKLSSRHHKMCSHCSF